jgi:hypothetical protein
MPYFDTLEYVDANSVTQEIALKSSNLSANGPAVRLLFTPASHAPGTFVIEWPAPPETGISIPFRSRCKVYANRSSGTGAANSFSGGTIIFQGRRTDTGGRAEAQGVSTSITLSDAWWDLMHITYQIPWKYITGGTISSPTYTESDDPDIVMFQNNPALTYSPSPVGGCINTFQQLQDIIRHARVFGTGAHEVQIQLAGSGTLTGTVWSAGAPEFTPVYVSWYVARCMKCSEAIELCLRPHPAVFTELDYSTTPPTLHVRDRAAMTAINLPYATTDANGVIHVASDIEPLNELVPDAVRLYYKIHDTVNGQQVVGHYNDHYPSSANRLLSLDYPIDITGSSRQSTVVDVTTSAFDATDKNGWRQRVQSLRQIADGGQIPNDGAAGALAFVDAANYNASTHPKGIRVVGDDGTDYSANYASVLPYLCEEDLYAWMTLPGGGGISAKRCTVSAFFTYHKVTAIADTVNAVTNTFTDRMKEHQHTFRVVLTDAGSGRYVLNQTLAGGESVPLGLAQAIWTELQTLQWRLSHEIFQVAADDHSLPTFIKPGLHKINLAGGHADWTTINAVPERVRIELFRTGENKLAARTSISCGPVNHLEPGYLIQLSNLFINRNRVNIDPNQRLGSLSATQLDLSSDGTLENSLPAVPVPSVRAQVSADGSVMLYNDAENGLIMIR